MQQFYKIPALLALVLATALAACAPGTAPSAGMEARSSFAEPNPQPRLGFDGFTPPAF